jgi:tRNA pseudouridine38-40 synthase
MSAVSPNETNQHLRSKVGDDASAAKHPLEVEGTVPPEPKRVKIGSGENPDIGSDMGSHVSGPSGTSETARKSQKGKQNENNKGRRRGTRPQVDYTDHPKTPRLPKKQCAVLIGFSGTNYAGMQM